MIRKQNSIFKNFGMNFYEIQVVYLGLLILYNTYMVICILLYIYVNCKQHANEHTNSNTTCKQIDVVSLYCICNDGSK